LTSAIVLQIEERTMSRSRSLSLFIVAIVLGSVMAGAPLAFGGRPPAQDPGDELWVSRYDGLGGGDDTADAVGVSPDGARVFVAGEINVGPSTDYGAVAYDAASGDRLWEATFGSNQNDLVTALAVSPHGERIFVTGFFVCCHDYVTVALDATTGAHLWSSEYDAGSTDEPSAVAVSPDGSKVFVTGFSWSLKYDYATVAYDAITGDQLWLNRYHGGGTREDIAVDLAVSPDGSRLFVTGSSDETPDRNDYATVAYDAHSGTTLWVKRLKRGSDDIAFALGVSPDGSRVFVTGRSETGYTTVAYDADTGARLWVRGFPPGSAPSSLAVSSDGTTVFITGFRGGPHFFTVAHDAATGARLWSSTYDGPGDEDYAHSIGVSPDGTTVFVTGESLPLVGENDFATAAYDASNGGQVWVSRYDGPANSFDEAFSLTIAPDGASVFVTGSSPGVGTGLDFATVAYSA
jgi:outer membrane protein assembly factor BamB